MLIGVLLPALGRARDSGRVTRCLANQRQLALAWTLYASDYRDRAMPLAYWQTADIAAANAAFNTPGSTEQIFWWGSHGTDETAPQYHRGFISPYLDAAYAASSVLECPSQPWGTYDPQGPGERLTSTYGYNGYYLSPARTPGWGGAIGFRPWRRVFEIGRPCELFVFADCLLPMALPTNCALLDPPRLYASGGRWSTNYAPTTAFRHGARGETPGASITARADGSVKPINAEPPWIVEGVVGSVGTENGPHYVPDWRDWR